MAVIMADLIFLALLFLVNKNNLAVCEVQEVWRSTDMAKNACDQEAEYQKTGKFQEPKKDDQNSNKRCGWFSKGIPRDDACADIRMHFSSCKDLIIGSDEASARVVNGTKPRRNYVFKSLANFGGCTASIIDKNFVITAGHCIDPASTSKPTKVFLGSYQKKDPQRQELLIIEKIAHENYTPKPNFDFNYDLALLKIVSASFNDFVQPATLPPSPDFVAMGPAYFIGYGGTENDDERDLREITLPVIPNQKCQKFFTSNITDRLVCAGYEEKGKGLCNGDSGGPLYACKNYRLVQIGTLSGGKPPCGTGPAVFSRLSSYLDWISSTIEKYTDPPLPTNPPKQ